MKLIKITYGTVVLAAVFAATVPALAQTRKPDGDDLAKRFATPGIDRFAGLAIDGGAGGVPLIPGCAAVFECANRSQYAEGDHVIFVGEVERCTASAAPSGSC